MSDYYPPYDITGKMLDLVSKISEKVGNINAYNDLKSKPHLRKNNRIRSIHASLKIEANSLSLPEVRDVINGQLVLGNQKEIQEVKNAYEAYELIPDINPYSIEDLKRIHGIMTYKTVEESGDFRKGEEGVFSGDKCIFVAPPPKLVPNQMKELLLWAKENKDKIHPLILSAIFHYELVLIHPFSDGNGRMARLWQSVFLYNWKNIFEYIPIESRIENFQSEYYDAISQSHARGNSNPFIEFMLNMINQILDETIDQIGKTNAETTVYIKRMLDVMEYDIPYTANEIMGALGLKSKETFRKNYINPGIELGLIRMTIPSKPKSKNQRYIKN